LIIAAEVGRNIAKFDCDKCTWGRFCSEDNPAPFAKWDIKGVIKSKVCLKPMITDRSAMFIRMYRNKDRGNPFAGGYFEQPNLYIEAMEVIEGVISAD
jgi:hypothetical protein